MKRILFLLAAVACWCIPLSWQYARGADGDPPPLPPGLYENIAVQMRGICVECHRPAMLSRKLGLRDNAFFQALIKKKLPEDTEALYGETINSTFMDVAKAISPYVNDHHFQPAHQPGDPQAAATDKRWQDFLAMRKRYKERAEELEDSPELRASLLGVSVGQLVFDGFCADCHRNAAMSLAPQIADGPVWQARMANNERWREQFYESATKGKGVMPPQAAVPSLDAETVKAAVDYMVTKIQP